MRNPLDLVIVLQGVFALCFFVVAALILRSRTRYRAFGARTTGTIVALRAQGALVHAGQQGGPPPVVVQTATIRFFTIDGEEITTSSELVGSVAGGRPGERVRVLYDPENPLRMEVDTTLGRGVMTAVWLLAMGTLIELVAVATATLTLMATN